MELVIKPLTQVLRCPVPSIQNIDMTTTTSPKQVSQTLSRHVRIKDLREAVAADKIAESFSATLGIAGLLSVSGVVDSIDEPRSGNEGYVRLWIRERKGMGTDDFRFRLSVDKEQFEATGIQKGDAVFAIGKLKAWNSGWLSVGFSLDVETLEKDGDSPDELSLEHRYNQAVVERDELQMKADKLEMMLDEVKKQLDKVTRTLSQSNEE